MYTSVNPKVNFPSLEESILEFWAKNAIFPRSIKNRDGAPNYILYDGPPFATGLPHYGHLIQSALKDTFPRYKTMRGYRVERRFGWDCHGLPVEYEMEKELGISGKTQIEKYGVAAFNEKCRSIVLRYTKEWRDYITRLGRWVDFDDDYKTMDLDYMESVWWVFKRLWDDNLVKSGHYILPYCPRCCTALSNNELSLGGYKDVSDLSATVKFAVEDEPDTYILAWTTTPWTLPSNLALAVHPDLSYLKVELDGKFYYIAEARVEALFGLEPSPAVVWRGTGADLIDKRYRPLMPFFAHLASVGAFKVYPADYVSADNGTGIVHIASGFGEDDYNVLKHTAVPVTSPIDEECRFTQEVAPYAGRFVKDCDADIVSALKTEGKLFTSAKYLHSYPFCWRCSSPLIYRAIESRFINVPAIKERMLAANEQITWIPSHLKEGRFGKWLANARDWAVSRNRYWGNPIPIWRCDSCKKEIAIGSRAELKELSGQSPADLHKHFIDSITIPCSCGGVMTRISEVFDCWFESGSMPYAQAHYPFEKSDAIDPIFPADFIAEGIDQTRGWFYTLTVLGAALFNKPAFKMCVTTGMVLAADGRKMSKSLRNYTDPLEVVNAFGADAVRVYLLQSALPGGEDLKFSDEGVKDSLKNVILPLWSAYGFYVTYANIDGLEATGDIARIAAPLDLWLVSLTRKLIVNVETAMDEGDVHGAISPIMNYIDALNNWYIRRSRRRFWKSDDDDDKRLAYETLRFALVTLSKVAAPFLPFVTEEIYRNLRDKNAPESVHLCDWPAAEAEKRDLDLERKMELAIRTVSMGRALRSSLNMKNRLPLQTMFLVSRDPADRAVLEEMRGIIAEELNVKEAFVRENEGDLVEYEAKANFKILGKILGQDMKAAAAEVEKLTGSSIAALLDGATITVSFLGKEHQTVALTRESVVIRRIEKENLRAINEGAITVAFDTTITDALETEGAARDLIRGIQSLRKERELDVSDRITLFIPQGSERLEKVLVSFIDLIKSETLALEIKRESGSAPVTVICGESESVIDLSKR